MFVKVIVVVIILVFADTGSPCLWKKKENNVEKLDYWPNLTCDYYYDERNVFFPFITKTCLNRNSKRRKFLNSINITDSKGCVLYSFGAIIYFHDGRGKMYSNLQGFHDTMKYVYGEWASGQWDLTEKWKHMEVMLGKADDCKPKFDKVRDLPSTKWNDFYTCIEKALEKCSWYDTYFG